MNYGNRFGGFLGKSCCEVRLCFILFSHPFLPRKCGTRVAPKGKKKKSNESSIITEAPLKRFHVAIINVGRRIWGSIWILMSSGTRFPSRGEIDLFRICSLKRSHVHYLMYKAIQGLSILDEKEDMKLLQKLVATWISLMSRSQKISVIVLLSLYWINFQFKLRGWFRWCSW